MNLVQQILTIGLAAVTNFVTRWLPFGLFTNSKRDRQDINPFIKELGDFLPPAIMAMLVVYCYRNLDLTGPNHGLPQLLAGAVTVLIHLWRHSMFLSLVTGTAVYIFLVNVVF